MGSEASAMCSRKSNKRGSQAAPNVQEVHPDSIQELREAFDLFDVEGAGDIVFATPPRHRTALHLMNRSLAIDPSQVASTTDSPPSASRGSLPATAFAPLASS